MRQKLARTATTAAAGLSLALLPTASGSAADPAPTLQLRSVVPHVTAVRWVDDPSVYLYSGLYVAAVNGAFEVDAIRNADGSVSAYPTRRDGGTVTRGKALRTPSPVSMTEGLPGFFSYAVKNAKGRSVAAGSAPFCPGGWYGSSRVDATGPDRPVFPFYCGSPLTRGAVWGIDRGWASPLSLALDGASIPDGDYTLDISVASTYVRQLALSTATTTASVALTVVTDTGGGGCTPDVPCPERTRRLGGRQEAGPLGVRGAESNGDQGLAAGPGGLPNMAALPAHNLTTANEEGRDLLSFGATIWNAGPGPLVIEGFRRGAEDLMDAVQFRYENGAAVGSDPIGDLEFDRREGHFHWHFLDAARYDLLDSTGTQSVASGKQSFCLVPTDPVDLTLPGAAWQPDRAGLWSACGGEDAIWIREVMPAGWGDTYYQGVAGQAFDITDLPNGTYTLRVWTNPEGRILETRYDDNTASVTVTLGGTPGARTVG